MKEGSLFKYADEEGTKERIEYKVVYDPKADKEAEHNCPDEQQSIHKEAVIESARAKELFSMIEDMELKNESDEEEEGEDEEDGEH